MCTNFATATSNRDKMLAEYKQPLAKSQGVYFLINVFFKDMRLEKYTLEVRKFGQGTKWRAQTWRERTNLTEDNQNA